MRALIEYLEQASEEGRLEHSMEQVTEGFSSGLMHPDIVVDISSAFENDTRGFSADYFAAYVEWQRIEEQVIFESP